MPGHRVARILALGLALTTVGCSVLAQPTTVPGASAAPSGAPASPDETFFAPTLAPTGPASLPSAEQASEPVSSTSEPASSTRTQVPTAVAIADPTNSATDHVDPELEAMLPRRIGGMATSTLSRTGADTWCCDGYGMSFLPGPPQAFAASLGSSIDDMTVAEAYAAETGGSAVFVRALRVRGADTSRLVDAWLALLDAELQGASPDPYQHRYVVPRVIGAKPVTVVADTNFGMWWDSLDYLYPYRDVLFVVVDTTYNEFSPDWPRLEPTADEIAAIAALP